MPVAAKRGHENQEKNNKGKRFIRDFQEHWQQQQQTKFLTVCDDVVRADAGVAPLLAQLLKCPSIDSI